MFRQKANITSARRIFTGRWRIFLCFKWRFASEIDSIIYDESDNEINEHDDDTNIAETLMTPIIALHDLFAVDDSCPQVALAEEKQEDAKR